MVRFMRDAVERLYLLTEIVSRRTHAHIKLFTVRSHVAINKFRYQLLAYDTSI